MVGFDPSWEVVGQSSLALASVIGRTIALSFSVNLGSTLVHAASSISLSTTVVVFRIVGL